MGARTDVTFNNYVLQNSTVSVKTAEHFGSPNRSLQVEDIGREHKQALASALYKSKVIVVEGYIHASTQALMHGEVDDLKEAMDAENANLDIDFEGGTRRYHATPRVVEIPEDYFNLTFVAYRVEFLCVEPFGYATTTSSRAISTIHTAELDATVTFAGTFDPEPTVTIDLIDNDGVTQIVLQNLTTGDSITIGTAFADGDEIILNHATKKVLWNNAEMDYSGLFPQWVVGSNHFILNITGGTQTTADLEFVYTPRYL